MSEPKPKYFDDNGVAFAPQDAMGPDFFSNELPKLEGEHSRRTIQLGRYRHALRTFAGLTETSAKINGQDQMQEVARNVLKQYDDHH